jgi:hypothetical protein
VVLYRFYMAVSGIDRTNQLYVGVSFLNAVSMPVQKNLSFNFVHVWSSFVLCHLFL